ncbi:zinc finger CCCH-type antiviral protein 1-like [Macrobrachium nipponense]|uniref:zinc finger CCCH-type antiviral protein 1-like n=1 Tax=Macrobrachium nipponense TaxID=159736 RepID=UPI0030C899D2
MPSSHRSFGFPSNSSSTTHCGHGDERENLSSSLTKVEISHNDSSNSLSSLATGYISDDDTLDKSRNSSSKSQSSCQRRPTPLQSVIFFRRDLDLDLDGSNEEGDDSDFWDQTNRRRHHYTSSLEDAEENDENETKEEKESDAHPNAQSTEKAEENYEPSSIYSYVSESINREWVTAKALAEKLAHYPHSKASLSSLSESHGFHIKSVMALVACNSRIFMLNDDTVYLRPQISMCFSHLSLDGCQNESVCEGLHICPLYLEGKCKDEECSLGHSGDTRHNLRILNEFCLQSVPPHLLQKVIEEAVTYPRPKLLEVCDEYNQGLCVMKECKKLHICKHYIAGLAHCPRLFCSLNHSFRELSVERILENHGLKMKESPKDIVKTLHKVNPHLAEQLPFETVEEESHMPITIWSTYAYGDVDVPEICYRSIERICEYERSGCKRLHCERPFHWQVRETDGCWLNLTPSQVYWLELAYCDPEQDSVMLPQLEQTYLEHSVGGLALLLNQTKWKANFETKNGIFTLTSDHDVLELRRLCCEDVGLNVPGSEFIWYYRNRRGKFVEYGMRDSAGEGYDDLSEISSQCLENVYQNHMDESSKMHFATSKYTYHLDVNTMTQLNEIDQTRCQVQRRPKPHIMEKQIQTLQRRPSFYV